MYVPHKEIKFGDASPVVQANRDNIVFDEFEYDQTSVRRIAALLAQHRCSLHVHPLPVCVVSLATHTCIAYAYHICRTDFSGGIIWWHDYDVAKRRGQC